MPTGSSARSRRDALHFRKRTAPRSNAAPRSPASPRARRSELPRSGAGGERERAREGQAASAPSPLAARLATHPTARETAARARAGQSASCANSASCRARCARRLRHVAAFAMSDKASEAALEDAGFDVRALLDELFDAVRGAGDVRKQSGARGRRPGDLEIKRTEGLRTRASHFLPAGPMPLR